MSEGRRKTLADRSAGTHEIKVLAAADNLSVLAAEFAVTVEVNEAPRSKLRGIRRRRIHEEPVSLVIGWSVFLPFSLMGRSCPEKIETVSRH